MHSRRFRNNETSSSHAIFLVPIFLIDFHAKQWDQIVRCSGRVSNSSRNSLTYISTQQKQELKQKQKQKQKQKHKTEQRKIAFTFPFFFSFHSSRAGVCTGFGCSEGDNDTIALSVYFHQATMVKYRTDVVLDWLDLIGWCETFFPFSPSLLCERAPNQLCKLALKSANDRPHADDSA